MPPSAISQLLKILFGNQSVNCHSSGGYLLQLSLCLLAVILFYVIKNGRGLPLLHYIFGLGVHPLLSESAAQEPSFLLCSQTPHSLFSIHIFILNSLPLLANSFIGFMMFGTSWTAWIWFLVPSIQTQLVSQERIRFMLEEICVLTQVWSMFFVFV